MKALGKSAATLARDAGIHPSTLTKLFNSEDREPDTATLHKLIKPLSDDQLQISYNWFFEKNYFPEPKASVPCELAEMPSEYIGPKLVIIPEIDGFVGMGSMEGTVEIEYENGTLTEPVRANWHFPPSWLTSIGLKPHSDGLYLIEGLGDSNSPIIHSGDKLLINTKDRTPSPPGFFALWDGLGVTVKRLEVILKSDPIRLKVSSANPSYSSMELTIDEVNIIGRVWAGVMRF